MNELRILSIIPPMTQLNTPYPSTAYLTGFLRSRGFEAEQADLSIALALKLLSVQGLQVIHGQVSGLSRKQHTIVTRFFAAHFESYRSTISPVIRFLQGRDSSLAHRIVSRHYLPEGPRFASLEGALDWASVLDVFYQRKQRALARIERYEIEVVEDARLVHLAQLGVAITAPQYGDD